MQILTDKSKVKVAKLFLSPFCSLPLTSYAAFVAYWIVLFVCSSSNCLTVFRTVMHFLGIYVYVSAMVDGLAVALDDLDKSVCDQPFESSAQSGGSVQRNLSAS